MKNELKLTLKQRKFIKYYIETGNASEASRRAGYALGKEQGYENLTIGESQPQNHNSCGEQYRRR